MYGGINQLKWRHKWRDNKSKNVLILLRVFEKTRSLRLCDYMGFGNSHHAKYVFSCEGKNVEVSVNGNPVEVVSINGRTSYIAKVTERGCITITVDK